MNPATVPISVAMQRPAWRDTFSSLRLHNYRLYVSSQFISNTAGWMQRIAVDWLVLELTGSVALVGLTIAIQFLPTLLFGAHAGVLADRVPKRALILTTQTIITALNVVLAVLAILGTVTLMGVYALVLGIGILQVIEGPARMVFVSELVGPRHLRNAISLNASIFHFGALIGPAISGALIVAVGSGWAIGANAIAGVIAIILILAIRQRELLIAPRAPGSRGQVREAVRYILRKPTLFWTLLMACFVAVFGMPMPTLLAGLANSVYETGATGYGLYNSLAAVGAFVGALVSARRSSLRLRTIIFGAMLYGALFSLAGLSPIYGVFLALLVGVGFARLLLNIASETMLQFSSNLAIRGRVMAFWALVVVGGQAIGGPLVGGLAQLLGPATAMAICGGIIVLASAVIALILARNGRLTVLVTPRRRGSWVAIVPRAKRRPAG